MRRARSRAFSLNPTDIALRNTCLEVTDHASLRKPAVDFFGLGNQRDPQPRAARIAEQFIECNRNLMSSVDARIESDYDGSEVSLTITTGSSVGAIPLVSPTTARYDYGLVVQPRFPWIGLGPILGEMGWRVTPKPLRLPLLHRSERRVPPWVLSSMVLARLKALLQSLDRKFEMSEENRAGPKGRVNWTSYATTSVPRAKFLSVPCVFADLQADRSLLGAIRHTLERQLSTLESQRHHGIFVHRLIDLAQELLRSVEFVPPYVPPPSKFASWLSRPLRTDTLVDGLQAIEWTIEERGLGGLSDLDGIPWVMPMENFFEAWVETIFGNVARRTNGRAKIGRRRETTHPIAWDPPYLGSQKSLIPDIWIEWEGVSLIVDAKYKRHWEEMQRVSWVDADERFRQDHRNDLLQVLAYANLSRTDTTIVCLAYPCSKENWGFLAGQRRALHRAEVSNGARAIHLWLTAVPMTCGAEAIAAPFVTELMPVLRQQSLT